jgi:hypothetical protein
MERFWVVLLETTDVHPDHVNGWSIRFFWSYSRCACDNFPILTFTGSKIVPRDKLTNQRLLIACEMYMNPAPLFGFIKLHPKVNCWAENRDGFQICKKMGETRRVDHCSIHSRSTRDSFKGVGSNLSRLNLLIYRQIHGLWILRMIFHNMPFIKRLGFKFVTAKLAHIQRDPRFRNSYFYI